jgi:alkylation response protein AidB-like acyl-CoA dehydrogenase
MTFPELSGRSAAALEEWLGDPLDDPRAGSFRTAVEDDRAQRFPQRLCDAVFDWGVAEQLLPPECGGQLRSIDECLALSRVLSRRDLTAAVAFGASLLASIPIWLRGSTRQKELVAATLRSRGFLAFALSERDHGADLTAGEVTADRNADGWRINGTKWLINNAGHAAGATIAARTGTGLRSLSLFLAPHPADDSWLTLPKIVTHGLAGSAFGGMTFNGLQAGPDAVIGRPGEGLELAVKTLQITRVLVAGFALGALDTTLGAALSFARQRRLYGAPIIELEAVGRRFVDAHAEQLIGETLAQAACRAAHLAPAQLPLMSACVKYLVPQLATDSIDSLCVVLGARSYVRGEHWHGIVEKMRRDCAVTVLFDGSSPVNLNIIADHLPGLAQRRAAGAPEPLPDGMFTDAPAGGSGWPGADTLDLMTDDDAVQAGVAQARVVVAEEPAGFPHRLHLLELLDWCEAELHILDEEVALAAREPGWHRSGTAYALAVRYSHLHAAGACAWKWLQHRQDGHDWLVLCLRRLTTRLGAEWEAFDDIDQAALARLEVGAERFSSAVPAGP